MTNDWAVVFLILIFLVMNVVLMNLLIAIMSNTCKPPHTCSAVDVSRVHNCRVVRNTANGDQVKTASEEQGLEFRV